jgi:putative phosphoribosyl transferase
LALGRLRCEKKLLVIAGATHLFAEPGTLEEAANFAASWFTRHLGHLGNPADRSCGE